MADESTVGAPGVTDEDINERKQRFLELEAAHCRAAFLADASKRLATSLDHKAILDTLVALCVGSVADWCVVDVVEAEDSIRRAATGHADAARAAIVAQLARLPPGVNAENQVVTSLQNGRSLLVPEAPGLIVLDEPVSALDGPHG